MCECDEGEKSGKISQDDEARIWKDFPDVSIWNLKHGLRVLTGWFQI